MAYERTVQAALRESGSIKEIAEALWTEIPEMGAGRKKTGSDQESLTRYLMDARKAIMNAGGEERSVATLRHYREVARWVHENEPGGGSVFRWVEECSFAVHYEAMSAKWTVDRLRSEKPKNSRVIRPNKSDKTPAPEAMQRWSIDDRRAAARALAADEDVWDDQETRAAITQEVDRHRDDRMDKRKEKAAQRRRDHAPVEQAFDQKQAVLDLSKALTEFIKSVDKIQPRLGKLPAVDRFFLLEGADQADDRVAMIRRYAEAGDTELNRFLDTVLKGENA